MSVDGPVQSRTPWGPRGPWRWWVLLLGPLAVALVYVANEWHWRWLLAKNPHELFAVWFLPVPVIFFLYRGLRQGNPLMLWLAGLAASFLCREIHFAGTDTGVYIALAVLAGWAWLWRERLLAVFLKGQTRYWLSAALLTYALSQLIARRVFRDVLPLERELHVILEEVVENTAHVLLFVVAWTGPWRRST